MLTPYVTHRNPDYWPNPEVFNPDRFKEEYPPFAYIPFSAGNRKYEIKDAPNTQSNSCIGQNFATMELKTITSKLIRKFRVRLDETHKVEPEAHAILRPKTGIKLFFEKR